MSNRSADAARDAPATVGSGVSVDEDTELERVIGTTRLGDLPPAEVRRLLHAAADYVADYLGRADTLPVLPDVRPGDVRSRLPAVPPAEPEPWERILTDVRTVVEPGLTHWNHPGFMAYFAISGSSPGIAAELLTAGFNVNAMLWRTGPAPTELEELACDWLRQMLDLPAEFRGHVNDTASTSTLVALAAARHRADPGAREAGLAGRAPLTVYASEHAHSSVDKAVLTLGLGLDAFRKIPTDDAFRMRAEALEQAMAGDRAAGRVPCAVVATAGTTSTTSIDPIAEIAAVCARAGVWLHVDAAYAGAAAICPEHRPTFDGVECADTIVVNPHKWLFTPVDCSVLLARRPEALREAFSVVPEYLRSSEVGVTNLMDYGFQLGRRFRALKLWMVIRAYGVEGLRERIRAHCAMARRFADWVHGAPDFELSAPVPFSTVCFRHIGGRDPQDDDRRNERLLEAVNRAGAVFLSHTRLRGRYVLRLAVGNLRTREEHVERAWQLLREEAHRLAPES